MKQQYAVVLIILYLLVLLVSYILIGFNLQYHQLLPTHDYDLLIQCAIVGGLGGLIYCLRGVYLSYCVRKNWDNQWVVWYLLRPVVSILCGGISYLFLKAGLLVLEAQKESNSSNLGFLALAFIAGYNVDKFLAKVEDLAKATWGIEKSRTQDNSNSTPSNNS